MSELNVHTVEILAHDGTTVRLIYDEDGDILDVLFGKNEGENKPSTGIELTEHIILQLNQTTRRAVGLILNNFSILAEQTEYGPRNFPLSKLKNLPDELRELVFHIVSSPPVNQFIQISSYQESATESVPCIYVIQQPITEYA